NGSGDIGSIFIAHPFIRTQALSLYGQAGFDYKNFKQQFLNTQVFEDTLSVFNVGGSIDVVDGLRGLTSAGLSLQRGVPRFLGSAARRGATSCRCSRSWTTARFGHSGPFFKERRNTATSLRPEPVCDSASPTDSSSASSTRNRSGLGLRIIAMSLRTSRRSSRFKRVIEASRMGQMQ